MYKINAIGKQCPIPLVMLKNNIKEHGKGNYQIIVDNKIAVENIEKLCRQFHYSFKYDQSGDEFICNVEVGTEVIVDENSVGSARVENHAHDESKARIGNIAHTENRAHDESVARVGNIAHTETAMGTETPTSNKIPAYNDVYIFDSNVLGDGDDKLGEILIKGFIFTLSQEDHIPKTIICYNSGVKLVCGQSESVQDFQELSKRGVDIVACGTCLDYYGLTEEIQVGRIVNMYDIVNIVNAANRVVRP